MIMCLKCQGWSDEEIRADRLRTIERHGWSVTTVLGDGTTTAFAYTVGLTRYHGHPELLVSGLRTATAGRFLNGLAEQIRGGKRYAAGQLLTKPSGHRWQFVPVDDPTRLVDAQETYASEAGLVPGLQVIWSDHDGHWPWHPDWTHGEGTQPLYGRPPRDYP
jgi:uncharacterized protein DUF4262